MAFFKFRFPGSRSDAEAGHVAPAESIEGLRRRARHRLIGAAVLIGFAATGLVAALLVPVTRFTPLVRMVTEWLELAAIVVAMPLAAWIGGLFTWVRMR